MSFVLLFRNLLDRRFAKIGRRLLFGELVRLEQGLNSIPINFFLEVVLHTSSLSVDVLIKIWHPDHYQFILCSSSKVITLFIELNCLDLSFMSQNCPAKSSLFQVPNFNLTIVWNRWHVVSVRMESQSVDGSVMSVVVLDQFTQSCVPKLDCAVDGWGCDACSIGSEFTA